MLNYIKIPRIFFILGYIGCYIDQHPNRDLTKLFTVNNLTPDSCRSVCKKKGHVYAGVQYGYLCHCGDGYGKYGEAGEHECNSACLGDEGKKCGGFWRNSVYTSGIAHKMYGDEELLALINKKVSFFFSSIFQNHEIRYYQ